MRTLVSILFILALLIGGAIAAPNFVDWNKYKPKAEAEFAKMTGLELDLAGDVSVAILPMPNVSIAKATIKTPQGDVIATADKLEGRVALAPLLKKKIDVVSATLINPNINLVTNKDGKQQWMTETLDTKMSKDKAPKSNGGQAVSLQKIRIENASLRIEDQKVDKVTAVENLTTDISADTLKGPFIFDGSVTFQSHDYTFKGKTGKLDGDTGNLTLNMTAGVEGADLDFAGVVNTKKPYGAQGQADIAISSIKDLASAYGAKDIPLNIKTLKLNGIVTANEKEFSAKDATFTLNDTVFTGKVEGNIKPMEIGATLAAQSPINFDQILPKSASNNGNSDKKATGQMNHPSNMLPKNIGKILPFPMDISLSAPAIIYKNNQYKDVSVRLARDTKNMAGKVDAKSIPGQGSVTLTLSAPVNSSQISIRSDVSSQNVNETLKAISGKGIDALSSVKTGSFVGAVTLSPRMIKLSDSTINLDDSAMNVFFEWPKAEKNAREKMSLDITADTLDLDKYAKTSTASETATSAQGSKPKADIKKMAKSYKMPIDMDFDVGVQTLKTGGKTFKGLRAQGKSRSNSVSFENLSLQDYAGVATTVSGALGNVRELKDIKLNIAAKSNDIKSSLQTLGMDTKSIPANLKAVSADGRVEGSIDAMNINGDINAFGADFGIKGDIADALNQPKLSNIVLRIANQNAMAFMRTFAPTMPNFVSLAKPMSVSMKVAQNGKAYTVSNIAGDMAGADISGNITLDTGAAKPSVNGALKFGKLSLQTAKGAQAKAGKAPSSSARWSADKIDSAWLSAANVALDISASSLTYETWDFGQSSLNFKLGGGSLNINSLKAGLYGGSVDMNGSVSALSGGGLSVKATPRLSNINLEPLVKSLVGNRLIKGKGIINLNADIAASGASQKSLVNALSGSGSTTGTGIVIDGFDLAGFTRSVNSKLNSSSDILGLMNTMKSGGSTSFDTMNGAFTMDKGIINITKLDLDGPLAIMTSSGDINLPTWRINTQHKVKLKEEGSDVPSFTIKLNGPLDNPAQGFAEGAINNYLSKKINSKLNKLLEDKVGDKLNGKLGDALGNQLGGEVGGVINNLLGLPQAQKKAAPAPAESEAAPTAPANDNTTAPAQKVAPQPIQPEEAINKLIEGLF